MKINIPFGTALTEIAVLPAGAKRSLEDPYEDKEAAKSRRQIVALALLLLLVAAAGFIRWKQQKSGHYFWQPAPVAATAMAAAAPVEPKK